MATEDMGAQKTKQGSKPKLAPKPSILTSTTRSTLQPRVLKPILIISESKENDKVSTSPISTGVVLSFVNSIACSPEECDSTHDSAVNNIAPSSAAIRRGRVTKAPKPLPYLVPISTRSDQRIVGRSISSAGQRRTGVTFATSTTKRFQRRRCRRVERTRSEKSTRVKGPELAYLVVDLESGTLAKSLDDLYEPQTRPLSTAAINLQRTQTAIEPSTQQRTMSVTTSNRPKPVPRQKPEISHITPAENKSNTLPLSPKTEKELPPLSNSSPNKEDTPSPTQQSTSSHLPVLKSGTSMSLLRSIDVRPPVTPRKRNTSTPEASPEQSTSLPLSPLCKDRAKSSSPTQSSNKPPPLPVKSELSRKIQHSIKKELKTKESPVSPEPYESPVACEENFSIYTHTNDSYGTPDITELDRPSSEYEILDAVDAPEEMYIDPTKSQQCSSTGKPKPPRPPPPSISAIRKAQQKRTINSANSKVLKSGNVKNLTKQRSNPHKTNVLHHGKSIDRSNEAKYQPDNHEEDCQVMDYEELDFPHVSSPVHSTLWRPPQLTVNNRRNEPSTAGSNAPALPSRTRDSTTPTKTQHRKKNASPIPSGFSSSGNIHSVTHEHKNDEIVDSGKSEPELTEPDYDDDCVYEPVDTSIPLIPQRTKKRIRGTRTQTGNNRYIMHNTPTNIHPSKPPAPQRRGSLTVKSGPSRSLSSASQRISRLTTATDSSNSPQTPVKSLPGGGKDVIEKVSQMKIQDEREVEEYVQMECKMGWQEGEDLQGVYVDMEPSREGMDEDEEDGPSMGPYASSNLLSSRPDLKT